MQLTSFRVRKFRNIIDRGEVAVDESVRCLVGMNESGKTAALSAQHRRNPVDGCTLDEQRDYPQWLLSRDCRENTIVDAVPVTATFTLEDADLALLEAALGPGLVPPSEVTVSRRYNEDLMQWSGAYDSRHAVENLLDRAGIRKKSSEHYRDVHDLDGIRAPPSATVCSSTSKPSHTKVEQ